MKEVPLTQGFVALVGDGDYERVMQFKWSVTHCGGYLYAVRTRRRTSGERGTEYLHHFLIGKRPGMVVDHVNGDGLDNRRENLRPATRSQNAANSKRRVTNTSGFKGAQWSKQKGRWRSRIHVNGKDIHLGFFVDPTEAGRAYVKAFTDIFGDFALVGLDAERGHDNALHTAYGG